MNVAPRMPVTSHLVTDYFVAPKPRKRQEWAGWCSHLTTTVLPFDQAHHSTGAPSLDASAQFACACFGTLRI